MRVQVRATHEGQSHSKGRPDVLRHLGLGTGGSTALLLHVERRQEMLHCLPAKETILAVSTSVKYYMHVDYHLHVFL